MILVRQVVLAPVILGCLANKAFPSAVSRIARFTPFIATMLVALIVGSTLAHSAAAAKASGGKLLAAVVGLHTSGFAIGCVHKGIITLPASSSDGLPMLVIWANHRHSLGLAQLM